MQTSGAVFQVFDSTGDTLEVQGVLTPAEIAAITDHWAIVQDDDPFSGLLQHHYSITPFVKNAYAHAYVEIVKLDPQYNPRTLVDFDLYLDEADLVFGIGWDNSKDQPSSTTFWTSLVVAGYQRGLGLDIQGFAIVEHDGDPDGWTDNSDTANSGVHFPQMEYVEETTFGITVGSGDWDTIAFRAAIVDTVKWPHFEDQVIAHEIGHSAGNSGTPEAHHLELGLMRDPLTIGDVNFTGTTLKRMRRIDKW